MAAATYDILVEANATFRLLMTLKDSGGTPLDLSGWEPRLQVRPSVESIDVLMDCRPTNGRLVMQDAAAGKILLHLDEAETARLDFSGAFYDLLIIGPIDAIRIMQGKFNVSPAVTR